MFSEEQGNVAIFSGLVCQSSAPGFWPDVAGACSSRSCEALMSPDPRHKDNQDVPVR